MATNYYRTGDRVVAHVTNLSDSSDADITASGFSERNVSISTYVVSGACDVKMLADSGGDFSSPETNITLDSFSGAGTSEGNETIITQNFTALRLTNTSGSPADFVLVGEPIEDGDE